jgi:hypothetical protein
VNLVDGSVMDTVDTPALMIEIRQLGGALGRRPDTTPGQLVNTGGPERPDTR